MNLDIVWLIVCTVLIFLMQPGFMCLESGLTRTKNNINVAIKNLIDLGISVLLFWSIGFGIAFGTSSNGVIGFSDFLVNPQAMEAKRTAFFLFQIGFCSTAATIVSGAAAERLRFKAYVVVTVLLSGLIYPVFAHWCWNGIDANTSGGFLGKIGFVDFAGSTVVHSVGGWVALAVVLIIGQRKGRFTPSRRSVKIQGSNLSFSVLGVMLIWLGWLGFNGGSLLQFSDRVPEIILNTILASAAGMLGAGYFSWQQCRKITVESLINGCLAGLVAITAGCDVVFPHLAVIIGFVGGLASVLVSSWLEFYRIDDAVGAIPVHLGAGIWGTLAVALYGRPELLETGLNRLEQVLVQLLGVVICGVWSFGVSWLSLKAIDRFVRFRVTHEAEELGLNVAEHYANSPLYEMLQVMDRQVAAQDLSLRVPVEPFTEVGQIAHRYNQVMERLEASTSELKGFNADLEAKVQQRTAELSQAKTQAEKASEAKSRFLANMSHELRTPLNAILGFTQLLQKENVTRSQRESLAIVNSSGEHLLALINDVLDLSKIETGRIPLNYSQFDLYRLLDVTQEMLEAQAKAKGLELKFQRHPNTPQYIRCDERKLRQVLINLLNNAIKFTERGSVTLRVKSNDTESLWFEVEDSGVGIAPEELGTLFEAFTQTESGRKSEEGTGLGLAISSKFVELMGGKLMVCSEKGVGTTFSFAVVASEVDAVDSQPSVKAKVIGLEPNQPRFKILVVDDRTFNREIVLRLLKPIGFHLKEAKNGKEAVEIWQEWQPHLIWMDMRMPVMDGYEATSYIKSQPSGKDTCIIALTASTFEEERASVIASGCDDFVRKPFKEAVLYEKMAQYLGVRYTYEDSLEVAAQPEKSLEAKDLNIMPVDWLTRLEEAAAELDEEAIAELIALIPDEETLLTRAIQAKVSDFDFDQIAQLTKQAIQNQPRSNND